MEVEDLGPFFVLLELVNSIKKIFSRFDAWSENSIALLIGFSTLPVAKNIYFLAIFLYGFHKIFMFILFESIKCVIWIKVSVITFILSAMFPIII